MATPTLHSHVSRSRQIWRGLVGLDVRLGIAEYLHSELGAAHFEPPAILRQKVRDGELGKKSGKGFYDWR